MYLTDDPSATYPFFLDEVQSYDYFLIESGQVVDHIEKEFRTIRTTLLPPAGNRIIEEGFRAIPYTCRGRQASL
jgi:hypothetical protein